MQFTYYNTFNKMTYTRICDAALYRLWAMSKTERLIGNRVIFKVRIWA